MLTYQRETNPFREGGPELVDGLAELRHRFEFKEAKVDKMYGPEFQRGGGLREGEVQRSTEESLPPLTTYCHVLLCMCARAGK